MVAFRRRFQRPLTATLILTASLTVGTVPATAMRLEPEPPPSPPGAATPAETWVPPTPGATPADLLRVFDPPAKPWSPGHRGIDLAARGEVVTPAEGVVRFVGTVVDRPVITLSHPDGTLSSFEPVTSGLEVGDRVSAGQALGEVDDQVAHCPVRCVHWGVRVPDGWAVGATLRDRYLDPALLLGWSEPSVLWPLQGTPSGLS